MLKWAVMLVSRLPLLWAFAGGCVLSAALISAFHGGTGTRSTDARGARETEPRQEPALAYRVERHHEVAAKERSASEEDSAPQAEPGSSVANVLTRLEAAYRAGLGAAGPDAAPMNARQEPTPPDPPQQAAETVPAAPTATTTLAEAAPEEAPAHEETAVVLAAAAPPTTPAPSPAGHSVPAPATDAPRALASLDDVRPRDIHIGDVQQNNYAGDVHQGDVYVVQQLAVLQYVELAAPSPSGRLHSRGNRLPGWNTRRAPLFATSLTNPDNPWGFDFPPTVLAK